MLSELTHSPAFSDTVSSSPTTSETGFNMNNGECIEEY